MRVHKVKHPHGGTISHCHITKEEATKLPLPKWPEDGLWEKTDHPALHKALNVKTKWFCLTIC